MIRYIDQDGRPVDPDMPSIETELILKMYRFMVLTRKWSEKAKILQRQGRLSTYPSPRGQEAANVGMGLALGKDDWFVPAFREQGTFFVLGIDAKSQFQYWAGDERGAIIPEGVRCLPICITIAAQFLHGLGLAMAAKIKGEKHAVLCCAGDGATSEGDFHEALNGAALFKVPVVFVIQNNQWAISVPVQKQSATETLAEKASAYGLEGFRVDGNDVIAVYTTISACLEKARVEHKPTLVELVTYRLDDHTTADDATKYRDPREVEEWLPREPIKRLKIYLMSERSVGEKELNEIENVAKLEISSAAESYLAETPADPRRIFSNMYVETPWHLIEQIEAFDERLGRRGER